MSIDFLSAAAYGEYLSIDDALKTVRLPSSPHGQVPNPQDVINRQDVYGLTMLTEGSSRGL